MTTGIVERRSATAIGVGSLGRDDGGRRVSVVTQWSTARSGATSAMTSSNSPSVTTTVAPAVAERVGDLAWAEEVVDRDDDGAEASGGEEDVQELRPVAHVQPDPVAPLDAEVAQGGRPSGRSARRTSAQLIGSSSKMTAGPSGRSRAHPDTQLAIPANISPTVIDRAD